MSTAVTANEQGWLRGPAFDGALLFGTAGLALLAGFAGRLGPEVFLTILALDIWLLGYPHVIATYTRLSFDTASFREHRWLVLAYDKKSGTKVTVRNVAATMPPKTAVPTA